MIRRWRRGIGTEAFTLASAAIVIGASSAFFCDAGIFAGALPIGAGRGWVGRGRAVAGIVVRSWSPFTASTLDRSSPIPVLIDTFDWSAATVDQSSATDPFG